MKEIKITQIKQSKRMCGPASLKIVLEYYGIIKSEKELKKLTKATSVFGTNSNNLIKVAKQFGFKANYSKNNSIKKLKNLINKKIPFIIGWFSKESGSHFSVVVGFEKDKIILIDPEIGEKRKIDLKDFFERWVDINWENISFFKKIYFSILIQIFGEKMVLKRNKLIKKSDLAFREIIVIKQ